MTEKDEAVLIEELAELEHKQWWNWSINVASKNDLCTETVKRWQNLWKPYSFLSEEEKEQDRKWARKVLEIIKKYPQIGLIYMQQTNYELSDEEREIAKDISSVFR